MHIASQREWAGRIVLGAALLAFLLESWGVSPQLDDSYITYRYARNLVEGSGLVYNLGERVEGFTNLLWTLIVAAGLWLGFEATLVGHAVGVACGLGALLATVAYSRALLPASSRWLGAAAAVAVLATTSFLRWSISGMETSLFTAAVTAALAAGARERLGWATCFLCIATLTRPDGALFALIVYADALLRGASPARRVWGASLAYGGVLILLTAFRLGYYGDVVPNTFHAKVGGVPLRMGLYYLGSFLRDGAGLLLVPAALAALRHPRCRAGAAAVAAVCAYVVAIGGDGFSQRFFVPIVPALAALAVQGAVTARAWSASAGVAMALLGVAALWQLALGDLPILVVAGLTLAAALYTWRRRARPSPRMALLGAGIAGLALIGLAAAKPSSLQELSEQLLTPKRSRLLEETRRIDARFEAHGVSQARKLLALDPAPELVAAAAIGSVGYHSRLPILDLFGLVDPTIAHQRTRAPEGAVRIAGHQRSHVEYVLARAPDIILIHRRQGPPDSWDHLTPAVEDLWAHASFDRDYVWDPEVGAYRRRAFTP
ncbi:MAG: hypothetical protein ABFS46_06030 [Myxococcota bacterium]